MTPAPPIQELQGCRNRGQKGQLPPPPSRSVNPTISTGGQIMSNTLILAPRFPDLPTALREAQTTSFIMAIFCIPLL